MKISFEKPPLVEIAAELRWGHRAPAPVVEPGAMLNISATTPSPVLEDFFARFSAEMLANSYGMAERLVPQGFPVVTSHPVYRFKKLPPNAGLPVYQLGTNTFSAHIAPPYQSWDEFEPALALGVEVLLRTRADAEKAVLFSSASVRYINAFGSDLAGSRSTEEFISDVLGINISL